MASSRASLRRNLSTCSRRKPTFSQTVSESNSAPDWNSMPMRARIFSRVLPVALVTSCPSNQIVPSVGVIRPSAFFSITDLPEPEPPSTTRLSPFCTSRSTPLSTSLEPKDFLTFSSFRMGVLTGQSPRTRWTGGSWRRGPKRPRQPWRAWPPGRRRSRRLRSDHPGNSP